MKIQLIGQALDEIRKEDQQNLEILENKVAQMETMCSYQEKELSSLRKEHERYEELDRLAHDMVDKLHMILPIIEIPFGIMLIIIAALVVLPNPIIIGIAVVALGCEIDAINTLMDKYPAIANGENGFWESYAEAFRNLFLDKKTIRKSMIRVYDLLLDRKGEHNSSKIELNRARMEIDALKRELLHLDGYISSIDYIIEKQYFEELSDTTDIVQFINRKKELKRVVTE